MESTAQSLQWYAFRMSVRTPHEAQAIARREGFETYYALRKQLKDASYDTPTDEAFQDKPLLPSVIFVKCTDAFALKMQDSKKMWPYRMPGEKSLCPITQRDIDVFRTAVESGCRNLEVIDENLAMGDKVRVLDGIFKDQEGYIVKIRGDKRFVISIPGVEDYGIYGVVGGVVAMMGFLNASMSGATSRFLTFELGRGDKDRLAKTFSSALIVHIAIAIIVFILAETVGLWFLCNKLNIPEGRMEAAHWVYQFSILATMLSITQVPYNATIIAHEKMDVYAYMEILNVTLKLLIVYLLTIGDFDKLKLYAVLTFAVSLIIMIIYRIYCLRHFKESRFHWVWDKTYLTPLLSFSGWDLYGNLAWTARQQGANFILNAFFGVVLNAANGIASIVQGSVLQFSSNVLLAFKPQIIKKYAQKDYEGMNQLLCVGTKASVILLLFVTIPCLLKTEYILQLWLNTVPKGAVFITKALLINNLITCINLIVVIGVHATGKMKLTGAINGTLLLSCLPVMYLLLKIGLGYESCYYLFIIATIVNFWCILFVLKKQMSQFKVRNFLTHAIIPLAISTSATYITCCFFERLIPNSLIFFIFYVLICIATTSIVFWLLSLNRGERYIIKQLLKSKLHRL